MQGVVRLVRVPVELASGATSADGKGIVDDPHRLATAGESADILIPADSIARVYRWPVAVSKDATVSGCVVVPRGGGCCSHVACSPDELWASVS